MAKWIVVKNKEVLRISSVESEMISEIKDCIDKLKIETDKLKNIDQVLAMTSVTNKNKSVELAKSRAKIVSRIGMIQSALEVLNAQIHKA